MRSGIKPHLKVCDAPLRTRDDAKYEKKSPQRFTG